MSREIGTVIELVRYPVKSMAGEVLSTIEVDWHGVAGDRQFAFQRIADKSGFPWLTGRQVPDLLLHRPRFSDPETANRSPIIVETPTGETVALGDAELLKSLAAAAGEKLGLLQVSRGTFDAMPISLVSTATHQRLDSVHAEALDRRRFRSNIVIDCEMSEQEWRGGRLIFGSAPDGTELLVADAIGRCAMTTIDPDTAQRDPTVIRTLVRHFENRIGVYASPAKPGSISVGNIVTLLA